MSNTKRDDCLSVAAVIELLIAAGMDKVETAADIEADAKNGEGPATDRTRDAWTELRERYGARFLCDIGAWHFACGVVLERQRWMAAATKPRPTPDLLQGFVENRRKRVVRSKPKRKKSAQR